MPWRFYRYMFVDVLRQFAITAVILVIVIAFGAAIKPLSSDNLLTGWDTLKYLLFAIVPMLQFALPFAGAFAATICLHRMAQDNEFIAMSVSGQSYVRLLAPMVVFGGVLTIVIAILAQSVIPYFIGKMAHAMTADLPRLLTNSIRQNAPFIQDDLVIWAEDIFLDTQNDDERMALDHVAVAKIDDDGKANMYFTATAAIVDVQRIENETSLYVGTRNTTQWTRGENGTGVLKGAREGKLTHAIDLPSLTKQRLSALTRNELLDLKERPSEYSYVQRLVLDLKIAMNRHEYTSKLYEKIEREGSLTFITATGGRSFIITPASINGTTFKSPINVRTINGNGDSSQLSPKQSSLSLDFLESGIIDSVTLRMQDVIVGAGEVGENQRGKLVIPSLHEETIEMPQLGLDMDLLELLNMAEQIQAPSIQSAVQKVYKEIDALSNHVAGRIGQRWAVSLLPILAILLGSLLAIRFTKLMPLSVYAKVFIPSVVALLLIFSGGQIVRDANIFGGFLIMWLGNAALAALVIFNWLRLRVT